MKSLLPRLFRLAALIFGGVFVYAALLKLRDPLLFQKDIESFDLLGDPWTAILAVSLPWLLLLNLSLIVFFGAIGSAWYRGLNIQCGCFGGAAVAPTYIELFIRDGVLLALGLALLWKETRSAPKSPSL